MDPIQTVAALLDRATGEGAQAAEALLTHTVGFAATAARGRIQSSSTEDRTEVRVRVWRSGGRAGTAEGPLAEADALLQGALDDAEAALEDPRSGPVGRTAADGTTSDVDDRRYGQLDAEDRREVLIAAEKATRAVDPRLEVSGFAYADERVVRTFANTRGVRQHEASTRFRIEGRVRSAALDLELREVLEGRAFATVASLPFGASLARRLLELAGERTTAAGPHRVVLPPRVLAEVIDVLSPHFRWEALDAGSSFLARARQGGDLRFSARLHLVDDGRLSGGVRSASFDDRGVAPVPLTLIRDGRVDGWYLDLARAREADVRPTGHEHGGQLRPGNLIMRGGTRSVNALLSEQTEPVVVLDHVRGLAEGLDLETGHLTCAASGRLVVPRNTTVGWLPHIRIEGDLTEVLANVVDLASDTDRYSHIDAPGAMVDGFTIHPS